MMKKTLLSCILFLCGTVLMTYGQAPIKIGKEENVELETAHPYSTSAPGIVFEKEFYSEGSGYIKIHFNDFDLAPGDFLQIAGTNSKEFINYVGKGHRAGDSEALAQKSFWSQSIFDERVTVRLYSNGPSKNYGFSVDKVAYGYGKDDVIQFSICGVDDKEQIACYEGTEMYDKARAVCRLVIGGSNLCTGWLIGNEGHIMTNNHCIGSARAASSVEFQFNYEYEDCNGRVSTRTDVVATTSTLIKTNSRLDYTLVKLPVNPTAEYGFLSLRSRRVAAGERIYIPQHPGGRRKQIAVKDDRSRSGFATVVGDGNRVTYQSDTEGGSSGSPVLSFADNLVVALHNTGGCNNGGNRNDNIIADIGSLMPDGGVDNDGGGTGPCNGTPNPTATVSKTDETSAGARDGSITFTFPDVAGRSSIEFSIDDGRSYPFNTADNSGSYTVRNVAPATYSLAVRWGDNSCSQSLGSVTIAPGGGATCTGCIDFNDYTLSSYSSSDRGQGIISNGGDTLTVANNGWKSINLNYTVTRNTVIEFDFSSSSEGEIHGVGFDTDANASSDRIFKVYGSQAWGITDFDNYNGGTRSYRIEVGDFYTGAFNRMVFACDDDANGGGSSVFSNVKVYELRSALSIDFSNYELGSYSTNDVGTATVIDAGASLSLMDNTWKSIPMDYKVTPNTVLEFDFVSKTEGEIMGIGFDDDEVAGADRIFKLHGTQDWGITTYDNYNEGVTSYKIPVGQFYTGDFDRLVFANDDDANAAGVAVFGNVRVYEDNSTKAAGRWENQYTVANRGTGSLDDEVVRGALRLEAYPNPVQSTLHLRGIDPTQSYEILNSIGKPVMYGIGDQLDTKTLKSGIYIIKTADQRSIRFMKK